VSKLAVAMTGGIGSGKSAVTQRFADHGVAIFDSDLVARELVQAGKPALREIAEQFGDAMLTASGELDRRRMREQVFADASLRRRLEAILHPRVRAELLHAVMHCTQPYCVLVIPLLTEVRADYDFVDRVLVTDVSPALQIGRVMQRDRCSVVDAERIVAVQAPRERRLALADDVIDNDGELSALVPIVDRLHRRYSILAGATVSR
jgi:dephospho-CoA kinase